MTVHRATDPQRNPATTGRLRVGGVLVATSGLVSRLVQADPAATAGVPGSGDPWLTGVTVAGLAAALVFFGLLLRHRRRIRQLTDRLGDLLTERREAIDNVPAGLYLLIESEPGHPRVAEMSDRALSLFGVSREQALAEFYGALRNLHPDDHERVLRASEEARLSDRNFRIEARFVVDGELRWLLFESWPRQTHQGTVWYGYVADVSDRYQAEARFRTIFESTPAAVVLQDAVTGEVIEANEQTWRSYGYTSFDEFQQNVSEVWIDGEYGFRNVVEKLHASLAAGGARFEWPSRHRDGSILWWDVTVTPIQLGGRACALVVSVEITEQKLAVDRLRESEDRFRQILQDVDGVAVQGYRLDGSVTYWNRASEVLYGHTRDEAMGGNLLELIIPPEMRDDVRASLETVASGGSIPNGELELMRKDGSRVPVYSSHTVSLPLNGEPELFCIDIDLSEHKAHEQALDRMANYDTLTELPNRRLMAELLDQLIARARRAGSSFALCYLDLDDFKPINDDHGHDVGDEVLKVIAKRLRGMVRGSDLVCRLGGDEFVIALEGLEQGAGLDHRLSALLAAVAQPIEVDRLKLEVRVSIGVTLFPEDSGDPDALLRHADQAMYRAKQHGRNGYSLFDTRLEASARRRRSRLSEIERGLDEEQFRLYYQPLIELETGAVSGFEGLVRWHHPEEGVLSPAAFLDVLDRSDLEPRFGESMLRQALEQLQAWQASGLETSISVNISGPHLLSQGFASQLGALLASCPEAFACKLVIEIVESAAVNDLECATDVLHQIRALGPTVSLDDFGTGYSSLSHLRSLPVDEVKIDQTFVRDMLADRSDFNIVQSVIGLSKAFDLRAVAEGVETEAHLSALRHLGCRYAQGYLFARPMPAEDVASWVVERSTLTGRAEA